MLQIDGDAIFIRAQGLFVVCQGQFEAIVGVAHHHATAHHAQHLEVIHAIPEGDGLGHLQPVLFKHGAQGITLVHPGVHHLETVRQGEGDVESITIMLIELVLDLQQLLDSALVVEPGVGFFDLYDAIQRAKAPLWLSVPGNAWGSVLGNALDHGIAEITVDTLYDAKAFYGR